MRILWKNCKFFYLNLFSEEGKDIDDVLNKFNTAN
jgi:hypothetical protein